MLLDKVTVGSDITAALYSIVNDSYFLYNAKRPPLFFETAPFRIFGSDRVDFIWSRALLLLSMQGKLITCHDFEKARITNEKIKISSKSENFEYCFNFCEIFDPTGLELDNEVVDPRGFDYVVHDDFELSNLGAKHSYLKPKIEKLESFASEIHFYTSDRVDGATYVTDCVVQSILTRENLQDFEYSDSMVRFAVKRYLEYIGVKGNFMKLYKSGAPKFRKPKVVHKNRVVTERDRNIYLDSENIKFLKLNLKEVFQ